MRLDGLAGALADVLDGRAGAFADVLHGLAGALDASPAPSPTSSTAPGALADILDSGSGALADVLDGGAGAFADVLDGGTAPSPTSSTRPGAFADVLDREPAPSPTSSTAEPAPSPSSPTALPAPWPTSSTALPEALGDVLEDLRVAVDRRQDAIDDPRDVVEPHLEQRLGLDALDLERHPAEGDVGPDVELQEVEHLGLQRDAGTQVFELEVDLVDLDDRHVEQDVRLVARVLARHDA